MYKAKSKKRRVLSERKCARCRRVLDSKGDHLCRRCRARIDRAAKQRLARSAWYDD